MPCHPNVLSWQQWWTSLQKQISDQTSLLPALSGITKQKDRIPFSRWTTARKEQTKTPSTTDTTQSYCCSRNREFHNAKPCPQQRYPDVAEKERRSNRCARVLSRVKNVGTDVAILYCVSKPSTAGVVSMRAFHYSCSQGLWYLAEVGFGVG